MTKLTQLIKAINANDIATVKTLINEGVELNSIYDLPPLARAASVGNVEMVKLLIEGGADVNLQMEEEADTALTIAALYGQIEVVKILVEAGADVNIGDCYGTKAVAMAASNGHEDVYNFLAPLTVPKFEPGATILAEAKRQKQRRNEKGIWVYKTEENSS
ncbi:ankyrin repeat domain-containing protein [Tolypothrix bouteillei VB521301]|uniref:Ankyrin repeat domain-containing protein n=1 Tax=Tolypothrix bouteillei VB521301 TaxID=1479485 RepID=A0A8S9TB07_9CYAN|nr:ankyrin repeat domain-containing protein [Tolypothrix bouteillei]KAF3889298.1 ankyrin repeat domain-containing protein [Tolypothrix bouteillei VB521301]